MQWHNFLICRKNWKCNYNTTNWISGTNYKRKWTEPTYRVRPCPKSGRRKITQNSIEVDAKQKTARGRPKKNWVEGIRKAMNERNLNEGQWEDRKQWSLGVGQRRKFWNRLTYIQYFTYVSIGLKSDNKHNVFSYQCLCGFICLRDLEDLHTP